MLQLQSKSVHDSEASSLSAAKVLAFTQHASGQICISLATSMSQVLLYHVQEEAMSQMLCTERALWALLLLSRLPTLWSMSMAW